MLPAPTQFCVARAPKALLWHGISQTAELPELTGNQKTRAVKPEAEVSRIVTLSTCGLFARPERPQPLSEINWLVYVTLSSSGPK